MAIVLFTDFGSGDIYVGQVKAVLQQLAPGIAMIDLLHDAPAFNVRASAHLLAALTPRFAEGSVFFAVVDPGVGGQRDVLAVRADRRWYVGPDNGLLSVVAARAHSTECLRVIWRPQHLSASFHGRDLFAPIAAALAAGGDLPLDWYDRREGLSVDFGAEDLAEIVYIDHYGNAHTGLRADTVARDATLRVGAHSLSYARVFSAAPTGEAFWYANSQGLVEIAVNRGSAAGSLGLKIGERVRWDAGAVGGSCA